MSIAEELSTAGLVVIEGRRRGIGRTHNVAAVEVRQTRTGRSHEGADDINSIVKPAGGVAYVERSGRVWLLADGPVKHGPAIVFSAEYRDDATDAQADAISALVSVLSDAYGLLDVDDAATADVDVVELDDVVED